VETWQAYGQVSILTLHFLLVVFVFFFLLAVFAAYCLLMLMKNISNCARIRMLRLLPRQEVKLDLILIFLLDNKWHKSEAKAFIMSMERRRLIFSWRFNVPTTTTMISPSASLNYIMSSPAPSQTHSQPAVASFGAWLLRNYGQRFRGTSYSRPWTAVIHFN